MFPATAVSYRSWSSVVGASRKICVRGRGRVAEQGIGCLLHLRDFDQLADGRIGAVRCGRVEQQLLAGVEPEAMANDVEAGRAREQAALAVVPVVGRETGPVPAGVDGDADRAREARAGVFDLEVDDGPVRSERTEPQRRVDRPARCGRRGRRHVELQDGRRDGRRGRLVVDEPGMADDRQPLGRGLERRLRRDAVLIVAEFVGHRRERLHQHDAEVCLRPLHPGGVAQGGELRQCLLEAGEVLGEVVDRHLLVRRLRAARRGRRAVERRGAVRFERERRLVEEGVELGARDGQAVGREVPGGGHRERQDRPPLAVGAPAGRLVDRADRDARDDFATGDRHRGGAGQAALHGHGVQEVDEQLGLAGGDVDVIDAVEESARREKQLSPVTGPPVQAHATVTVTAWFVWVSTRV